MTIDARLAITGLLAAFILSGCGGGGGGGGGGAAATAASKVYVFGNMSTNGKFNNYSTTYRISSVATSFTVPAGVMVNYSSAPNASSGLCVSRSLAASGQCVIRDNAVVPSGPVLLNASDITANYDIASRVFSLNMVNTGSKNLRSSATANGGKGNEVAQINFILSVPGTVPSLSAQDSLAVVSQERELSTHPQPTVDRQVVLSGALVNYQ